MKKTFLNHSMQWSMVFVLTFAAALPTNAQIGRIIRKTATTIKDAPNELDAVRSNVDLNVRVAEEELGIRRVKTRKTTSSNLNKIYEGTSWDEDKVIATWDDEALEFTLVRTYSEGELAGQPIVYSVNESTGEVIRNDGKLMATIKGDDVIFPEIGTLSINSKSGGGLSLDGKPIGKVTRTEATCYGKPFGHFRREVERPLVAFILYSEYASKEEMAKQKSAMEARDKAAAEGQAAFQDNLLKITAGTFQDPTGRRLSRITAQGDLLDVSEKRIAHIAANGLITDAITGSRIGMLHAKGFVEDETGSRIGHLNPNGDVTNSTGSRIGHIYPNGDFGDRTNSRVARFTGAGRYVAAVFYYFFFDFK